MKKISLFFLHIICFGLALAQDIDESSPMLQQAANAMRSRRFTEAEDIYRNLLQQNPDDMTLQQLLSHALMNQKRFRECDSILYKQVEIDSNNIGNYWYQGLSAERQQMDSAAAAKFKYYIFKSQNVHGQNLKAWLHVGSAYRRMMHSSGIDANQCADMIKHYKIYIEKVPGDPYIEDLKIFIEAISPKIPVPGKKLIWSEKD